MAPMFEPREDPREKAPASTGGRAGAYLGFVVGFGIGWLVWDRVVITLLRDTPTSDNPSGDPAAWIFYGSLAVCVGLALFVVTVIGEWIGSRRRRSSRAAGGDL